jgi:hypothetical protein
MFNVIAVNEKSECERRTIELTVISIKGERIKGNEIN